MAANVDQIFGKTPVWAWTTTPMVTANTTRTGASGTLYYLKDNGGSDFVAGAAGCYVRDLTLLPLGDNANATVCRIFVNNGSSDGTAANNILIGEKTLPVSTASEAAALAPVPILIDRHLAAGQKIFLTVGTAPTSAGWKAWMSGMDMSV